MSILEDPRTEYVRIWDLGISKCSTGLEYVSNSWALGF